jgi:1,4-alpha-glucan branching enzyme
MLNEFDRAMQELDERYHLLNDRLIEELAVHEEAKQLVYRRGSLVFAFNFHPTQSYADCRIPVPDAANYRVILSTDESRFGGHGRSQAGIVCPMQQVPMYGRNQSVEIYLPSRSAQVLAPVSD